MGQPKMLLPWGDTTVVGQVIYTFGASGTSEVLIVTGGAREAVEAEAARLTEKFPVRCVHNPAYETGEMLSSLQCGLARLGPEVDAALIGLGDQPQLSLDSARKVVAAFESSGASLVVPSYNLRRGHPWLAERGLWGEILALKAPETLRDFLNSHAGEILYVEAGWTILKDLDTPEDYQREKP
jgi:molybdenum cofactor cytidylyltransferase